MNPLPATDILYEIRLIPTRCRDLHLKQFCLEDIAPAILIILIAHIILTVRWMLIKILSVVINRRGEYKIPVCSVQSTSLCVFLNIDQRNNCYHQFRNWHCYPHS